MGMKNYSTDFFEIFKEIDTRLYEIKFTKVSLIKNGKIYIAEYKRNDCIVKFLYGPPEYRVEMIIYTSFKKYELKDLLENQNVLLWIKGNKFASDNDYDLKRELLWYINLLNFSLSYVECS